MSYLGILFLCFQACLVQHVVSQYLGVNAPLRNVTPVLGFSKPALSLKRPWGYRGWAGRSWGGCENRAAYGGRPGYGRCAPRVGTFGGAGTGNIAVDGDIPVAGNTAVGGQMPIVGAVQFGGTASAAGTVTITATCARGGGCKPPYIY